MSQSKKKTPKVFNKKNFPCKSNEKPYSCSLSIESEQKLPNPEFLNLEQQSLNEQNFLKTKEILKNPVSTVFQKILNSIRFQTSPQRRSTVQNAQIKEINHFKQEVKKLIQFVRLLMLTLKAIREFRWRTQYRSLDFATDRQVDFINDTTHIPQAEKNTNKSNFIKNKFIRLKIMALKKNLKHCYSIFHNTKVCFQKIVTCIPVIRPDKKIKIIWDLIIIFIISLYIFVIPMQLSFDMFYDEQLEHLFEKYHLNHSLISFIVIIPELMLIIDTLLKFITGYYENGIVVEDRGLIIHHYLRKGLVFDLISYFPVLMQGIFKVMLPELSLFLKSLQLLMFFKIKRVKTAISNYEEIIASNGKHDFLLSFCRLMYVIIFIAHLNACIWHAVAYFPPESFGATWLDNSNLKHAFWGKKYIYSLYWAISIMATIGYGEKISPSNSLECGVGVLILIVSVLLFGYCINSMKQLLDVMSKEENDYKETVRIINGYMSKHGVNFELQSRVRKYLEYTLKNETNTDSENLVLKKLNKSLKNELVMESLGKFLKEIPFFRENFSVSTIEKIVFSLRKIQLNPEEFLFTENTLDEQSIYITASGNMENVRTIKTTGSSQLLNKIKYGEVLGWYSFMTGEKRLTSVISKDFSTVYEIKKQDFLQIIQSNSTDHEHFSMMKDQIKSYNIWECFNSKCYSCFKSSHLVDKCPMIQYIPDRDLLIRKFNYSAIQNRNNNPKINIKKKKYNALGHLVATQISAFRISRKIVFDENENPEQSFSDEDEVHCESSHLKKKKSNEVNSLEYLLEKENDDTEEIGIFKRHTPEKMNNFETSPYLPKKLTIIPEKNIEMDNQDEREGTYNGKNLNKLHTKIKQKISNDNGTHQENELEEIYFDQVKNFDYYFPHNNAKKILETIEKFSAVKRKKEKKYHLQSSVHKLQHLSNFSSVKRKK